MSPPSSTSPLRKSGHSPIGSINENVIRIRVGHPDQGNARGEEVANLLRELDGQVVRGDHLDDQVRSDLAVPFLRHFAPRASFSHRSEGNVRNADLLGRLSGKIWKLPWAPLITPSR